MPLRIPGHARRAFTLVELLIVIVLMGIVLGALMKVLAGQQRFYRSASDLVETQNNIRDGADLLQGELRGISPSQGDIIGPLSATSIQFLKPVASAVVCAIANDRASFTVPPLSLATNTGLTSWGTTPKQGDSLLVFDPGPKDIASDDRWDAFTLSAAPSTGASCPTSTGFTTGSEATEGYTFTLSSGSLGSNIPSQGSAVRVLRRVKYSLYESSDGQWYLGYQECPGGTCTTIQPVSGPYVAGNSNGTGGLHFTYRDNTGAVTATPTAVARIDVTMRAATRSGFAILASSAASHVDSLTVSIAVRN